MQLATSMWVATTDPASLADLASPEALDRRSRPSRAAPGRWPRPSPGPARTTRSAPPRHSCSATASRSSDLLADGGDRLVGRLARIADRREQIELAVRNVLSRDPDAEEVALLDDYLAERADRPVEGCRQLVWSLLTSSEFRFNY